MRAALLTLILAATLVFAVAAGAATPVIKTPTPAQIQAGVRNAEHSQSLWATVNICDTKRFQNTLGVRGQMPALGFSASLSIVIQVNFFNRAKKRFEPIPKASMKIPLGTVATGLQQGGATFTFKPRTGLLNARIEFVWTRGGKVIGSTSSRTTGGHKTADFGNPAHFTAPQCQIR